MERWKSVTVFQKILLIVQVLAMVGFTVVYLMNGKMIVDGALAPVYVIGIGTSVLGAVSVLFQQEIFEKRRKNEHQNIYRPAMPGLGAMFAPTLTQIVFTAVSLLSFAAGLVG